MFSKLCSQALLQALVVLTGYLNIAFLYLSHRSANADVHIYTLSSEVYLTNEGVRTIVPSPK